MAPATTPAQAVRVDGAVKRFGGTTALAGVDLDVAEGTVFGLLGPNGAGKTTLVRVLATLLTPDAGRPGGVRRGRVRDGLERSDLADAADRPARTYSGGMRRRLDLASSLLTRPRILFLDEPTTGLDPRSRNEIWATVRELVREGTTLLLTTQYLEEADELADRIAVIDHGRVIAQGTGNELKNRVGGQILEVELASPGERERAQAVL